MNRYDGRFIDFTLSKDCKHRAYSVIISTRIFNNSCGVCMLEYSCETPRFSHLMTHDSNCCLLDDPRKSLNWKNKIHITSLFFSMIDRPCLLSLWKQNPPIWLKQMLTKYWRGFQICSEPGLLVCWWCAQIPVCSQEAGSNQREVPICHCCTQVMTTLLRSVFVRWWVILLSIFSF